MSVKATFLGSSGEIGASCAYYYLDGTGVFVDAGLHPKKRDRNAFPALDAVADEPCDAAVITHAHNDHIGGVPFLLKYFPHLKLFATRATRDLTGIVLKDTAKLLKSEIVGEYSEDTLSLYKPEVLKKIDLVMEGFKYDKKIRLTGAAGKSPATIILRRSGHILGSASVEISVAGKSLLHTSDINFRNQSVIAKANAPARHFDALVVESTNAGDSAPKDYESEKKRLAKYINEIVGDNGSVLVPAFALGKTQETLKILHSLALKGSIPRLPIYTAGIGRKISLVYDAYCYDAQMKEPGFEISDVPQEMIRYDELATGGYFKEPSIVVATSGMLNSGTISNKLVRRWAERKNFGVAIVGYQDEDSPGFELLRSKRGEPSPFSGGTIKRACRLESFRFTSHALLEDMVDYIEKVKPKTLFVVHGDEDASGSLASIIADSLPQTRVVIPKIGKAYEI